jgi:hypothetical protein
MKNHKRWLLSAIMIAGATYAFAPAAGAQEHHSQEHGVAVQTQSQKGQAGALLKTVREATERFKDVAQAEREHYSLVLGCVSGSDFGAMGLHYLNSALLDEANKTLVLDPTRPQIILYEATPDGGARLTGADFVIFADAWDAKHPNDPPKLMGQLLHLFEAPNRFGLPRFYTLHVWAWKENPNGAFVNWHPNVSCQSFNEQN